MIFVRLILFSIALGSSLPSALGMSSKFFREFGNEFPCESLSYQSGYYYAQRILDEWNVDEPVFAARIHISNIMEKAQQYYSLTFFKAFISERDVHQHTILMSLANIQFDNQLLELMKHAKHMLSYEDLVNFLCAQDSDGKTFLFHYIYINTGPKELVWLFNQIRNHITKHDLNKLFHLKNNNGETIIEHSKHLPHRYGTSPNLKVYTWLIEYQRLIF